MRTYPISREVSVDLLFLRDQHIESCKWKRRFIRIYFINQSTYLPPISIHRWKIRHIWWYFWYMYYTYTIYITERPWINRIWIHFSFVNFGISIFSRRQICETKSCFCFQFRVVVMKECVLCYQNNWWRFVFQNTKSHNIWFSAGIGRDRAKFEWINHFHVSLHQLMIAPNIYLCIEAVD